MLLRVPFGWGGKLDNNFLVRWLPFVLEKQEAESSSRARRQLHAVSPQSDAERTASDLCVMVCVSRGCVGRGRRVGFDPPAFHVRDELVRDLCEHIFRQPGHAQHVVACSVHIISEWNKLRTKKEKHRWISNSSDPVENRRSALWSRIWESESLLQEKNPSLSAHKPAFGAC